MISSKGLKKKKVLALGKGGGGELIYRLETKEITQETQVAFGCTPHCQTLLQINTQPHAPSV